MSVKLVKCQGMFKPGNIMLPTDSSPPRTPSTSESNSTLFKDKDLKVISSSREGWSPARIRAANAEALAFQEAAERAEDEESSAWATADEVSEPGVTDEDIRELLEMPVQVVRCCGLFRPQDIDPQLLTDISPPTTPVSYSKPSVFQDEGFTFISSSRDGWSPSRVRAADAECWAFHRAAQQALEETAAWAKDYEGPEPGATKEDIRIYTKLEGSEYKYWGVKDLDMTMEEFWARNDPDNTRERLADETSGPLPARAIPTSSKSPSSRPHIASRSKRRRKTPEVNLIHRVAKPAMVTPGSKKGIRKSLTGNIEDRYSEVYEHIQYIPNSSTEERTVVTNLFGTGSLDKAERCQTISGVNSSTFNPSTTKTAARGRPRKIQSGVVHSASSNPADWPTSTREDPPKRKRGRPAKEKHPTKSQDLHRSYGSNEKQKRPKAESKAKVTKPKPKNGRPIAPSFHRMRTRARGLAENLRHF